MSRFSFRPQLESLDGRCLPSGNPAIAIGDAALVAQSRIPQVEFGEVALTLTVDLDAGTRTWAATGSIEDSGTATTVGIKFGAIKSPVVSILQIDTLFTNADGTGTFTLHRTVISTAEGPELFVREGTWHVVDATGIYAGLSGHGTLTGTESGTLVVDTLTGALKAAT